MTERLDSEQWSRFWRRGTPTTFLGRYQDNYDGEIAEFWHSQFSQLPTDAHILDLATGNGAVAVLAADYCVRNSRNFRVSAIDYADIDPADLVLPSLSSETRERITFYPQCRMEMTGLDGDQFDAAISQFGFEYSDVSNAIPEVKRLLKPGGVFAVLMHREGSILHRQAEQGMQEVKYCQESPLVDLLEALLKRLQAVKASGNDPASDAEAEALRSRINDATGALHDAMDQFEEPAHLVFYLTNTMVVFRNEFSNRTLEEKLEWLSQVREETDAYQLRMMDLLSAARGARDIDEIERLLVEEKFHVTSSEPFSLEEGLFCHQVTARLT